jgi:hypothetical protein
MFAIQDRKRKRSPRGAGSYYFGAKVCWRFPDQRCLHGKPPVLDPAATLQAEVLGALAQIATLVVAFP